MVRTDSQENERETSRSRRALLALLAVLLAVVLSEGLARLAYLGLHHRVYARDDVEQLVLREPELDLPETAELGIARRRVLHPYLGYSLDHAPTMGVGSKVPPVQRREAGKLLVGVTGGSVAGQVRTVLGEALRDALRARGSTLEPVVIGLLVSGFKEPQQLASISWFLSLGAEFDVVVNLDGFNDIVLPYTDNYRVGIFPFYPRSWNWMVARRPSQDVLATAGEIAYLRRRESALVELGSGVLGRSALFGLFARARLRRDSARIAELQDTLATQDASPSFEAHGPFHPYDSLDDLYADAAGVWARSSILMHHALLARGSAYVHFLQPNQYVPGTKVLSENERRIAYDPGHPYAAPVIRGYPHLLRAAQEIQADGVHFVDATRVFEDERGDIYLDDCCHLNEEGKRLLASFIAVHTLDVLGL